MNSLVWKKSAVMFDHHFNAVEQQVSGQRDIPCCFDDVGGDDMAHRVWTERDHSRNL